MPTTHPLADYLKDLREIWSSGAALKETSYYSALANLLNEIGRTLKPRVRAILPIQNRGAGIPDGGLFTVDQFHHNADPQPMEGQGPARGVIEVKSTKEDAWLVADGEQVTRYWGKYHQVLVTNYRDFVLVGRDVNGNPVKLESYRLAPNEALFWAATLHPDKMEKEQGERFVEYLKRVMLHAAPLTDPKDVAWFLASYAREAKARVEGADLPALAALRDAMEESLGITFEGEKGEHFFRSTLVQTLFYGVFSAWVLWHKQNPKRQDLFDWRLSLYYLRVPVMQGLFEQVSAPMKLKPLGLIEVLDWAGETLNRVARADFFDKFEEGQAVQYFYEPFLEAFDPELRKQLGVWFTPPEIIQYMVARVDTVLRQELEIEDGLADPRVYVLDPCCGTGGYLVEVLKQIALSLQNKGGDALLANDLKRAALDRVFGFEILPAPFVIAHLQLALFLQNHGAPFSETKDERAGVYLTSALTGWEAPTHEAKDQIQQLAMSFPALKQEHEAAEKVKRTKPILVILGNPPYNAFAGVSPDEEQGLVEAYKVGLISEWGIKKFNLDDLYIRFFRLAERRIGEQSEKGVISYISNFSYLADPSFVVMRKRLLEEFDSLWFDCMNGDSRETGKLTPEGKPDPSVFSTERNKVGIRVGTAIGLSVRKTAGKKEPIVRFRNFWGATKRADLIESLKRDDLNADYQLSAPRTSNRFSFRPGDAAINYLEWPRLTELSAEGSYQGLSEDRRKALIEIDKNVLEARMRRYFDKSVSWAQLKDETNYLTESYVDFPADKVRGAALISEVFDSDRIRPYAMRPFDMQFCYYTSLRPIWRRHRPEFYRQAWNGNSFIVSRFNRSKDPEGIPVAFVTGLCDYHYLAPNACAFPLRLREAQAITRLQESVSKPTANLSPSVRAYLSTVGINDPDADVKTADLIWMHALAIANSPNYLQENEDGLRNDWPRIPLPNSVDLLLASAAFGHRIAALLDTEAEVKGVSSGAPLPRLKTVGILSLTENRALDIAQDLDVTVGWGHAGKEGVTMPGKGKLVERDYTPEERGSLDSSPQLGATTCDVYLNGGTYWKNIPINVWEYRIGGYQVIKKWLSYREHALLGRALTPYEAREVTYMVRRIASILLLGPDLDANYQSIKKSTFDWVA